MVEGGDDPCAQNETKESKTIDVLDQLKGIFGEDNVVIKDKEKEVVCKSNLDYGQECSLTINFDDIEEATETVELFSIREIYNLSESEMDKLRKDYRPSLLLGLPIYKITISGLSVNGVNLLERMREIGRAKRFRLLLPRFEGLKNYQQIPDYPIDRNTILSRLPNKYFDYDFEFDGVLRNIKGDLEFRPIFKEMDLFGLLHEYGHSVYADTQDNYRLLKSLSKRELAEIRNSTEELTPGNFNDQQKQIAAYMLEQERGANYEARNFLKKERVREALFPGSDGMQRINSLIENQMVPYSKRYSQ